MWLQMIERFAGHYTVIAPDTPGFGYSDPLPGSPMTIAEFGSATQAFTDALGLQRYAVFGMHTGGLIATWLAWNDPQRVSALVVDGYAAFTAEESALYGEAYLPPFVPQWDGSHLRWLWSRIREQKYFFPWYDGRAESAMLIAAQTTASTREAVMDVLDVGDTYRAGYAAAFRHNDHHWIAELKVPAWLVYRHGDPLLAHMPRLRDLPANVSVVEQPDGIPAMHADMERWLAHALAGEAAVQIMPKPDRAHGWSRQLIATTAGDMASWRRPGHGRLRVHLHAPGTRPATPTTLDPGTDAWLLPDLPGHGASSEIEAELDLPTMVAALLAAIEAEDATLPIMLETHGAAAGYVPALVAALGSRVEQVVVHTPWLLNAEEQALLLDGLPTMLIDRAGGYLCDAWQWERERHLIWPWMVHGASARRRVAAPSPSLVHDNVVELLRLDTRLRTLLRDATTPDLARMLRTLPAPLLVVSDPESDYQGRAVALLT